MRKTAIYQRKRVNTPGWLNIWVQSPTWLLGFLAAVAVCVAVYGANALWGRFDPGNAWGMGYGIAASVLLVALSLYGLRRRVVRVARLQRAWFYLQFHVYGGVLFLLLVLMHTHFSVPDGVLTSLLWVLSLWLVGSGLVGIVLQKWIPRLLTGGLSTEVNYARIAELLEGLQKDGAALAATASERVQALYRDRVAGQLQTIRPRMAYFIDPAGHIQRHSAFFEATRKFLAGEERQQFDALAALYRAKLELDAHATLQRALRSWLVLHIPVAMALIVLLAAHVVTVLYY
ncbi:MAG: hypothetical protein SH809_00600 [Rhodothermales bacterium]|nr:hypothetical protein [Rhodothermales bacterium]